VTPPIGIYVRVSSKGGREDEKFHSPREQRERAEALIRAKGFIPGPVFEDINVSGATAPARRPAMGALLDAIEAGELGGVAAFSLDRLSREPSHGDALVKRVTKAGGVILTPDIPDAIDSPTGEFTFGMLLQVAKLYRSQAGARFASAKERAILAGIPVGPPPVGYRLRPDRRLEVDPELAPVIRELFERWTRGDGRGALAEVLDAATGRTWSREAIPRIIKNRIYATGRMTHGTTVSPWEAGAIVDEPLWHAAQRVTPPRPSRSDAGWLLTGLARCGACHHTLKASTNSSAYGTYRNYKCRNRACPSRVSVSALRLEPWVVARSMEAATAIQTRAEAPDLGGLEDHLALTERRLAQALGPEAQDALGDAWASTVKSRRTERDDAAAALGEARSESGIEALELPLTEAWAGLSGEDRRAILRALWKEIRVGARGEGGTAVTFVARGPHVEVEVRLPEAWRNGRALLTARPDHRLPTVRPSGRGRSKRRTSADA
jgi:site-specific DNA recombinase